MTDIAAAAHEASTVRRATRAEWPAIARALRNAFVDDPVAVWMLRADPDRGRMLERGFALLLRRLWGAHEATYTTDGGVGAAIWEPPGSWRVSLPRQLALAPAIVAVYGRHTTRFLRLITLMEARHPREPHFYLPLLGVEPAWQGRGIGSALLRPVLERCDAEGTPAYLEASTPRNRALYERHGFTVTGVLEAGAGAPPLWQMWREPENAG